MKMSVIGSTKPYYTASKEEFDDFSGKIGGVCYMASDFDALKNESHEKTARRIAQTKNSGHHSVYDHNEINLYFEDIPKALAMVINNEKMYTTSEKSARYTKMNLSESEVILFDGNQGKYFVVEKSLAILQAQSDRTRFRIVQLKPTYGLFFDNVENELCLQNIEDLEQDINSASRYTRIILKNDEKALYDKWLEIFKDLIKDKYQEKFPDFFSDNKITKLAQENARYLISVFTPTSMVYSTTYRQLNYLYGFMKREIENKEQNKFYTLLKPAMEDFCRGLEETGYIDDILANNGKNRGLSLVNQHAYQPEEYFGDIYSTSYLGSYAQLAQAQRHRTINYTISILDNDIFYVPPILKNNPSLVEEWKNDCHRQSHCIPQGTLVRIDEQGTLDNFILKMKERKCSCSQLEINQQTNNILLKYTNALNARKERRSKFIINNDNGVEENNLPLFETQDNAIETKHSRADELMNYTKGSRCTFPGYTCPSPCKFGDGIIETREI